MSGEIAYQYPVFIFLAVGVAIGVFVILMKMVSTPEKPANWKCLLCGSSFKGKESDKYKYCPYCGTKRGTRIGPRSVAARNSFAEEENDIDYANIDEDLLH